MDLALIQMEVRPAEKEANIEHAFTLLEEAAKKADVLVLPEVWTTGYNLKYLEEQACRPDDELLERLADFARNKNIWLVSGSVPTYDEGKIYNRTYCYGPQGQSTYYDKVHLFSLLSEPKHFAAGRRRVTTEIGDVTAGFSICYDLRFPELYRSLAMDGATLIFVPAEWPKSRLLPWQNLNQARAIENQVYICAVNAVGTYKDNVFAGESALIAPDGEYVVRGGDREDILYASYQAERVEKVRTHMSVWADRREDIYE